MKIDTFIRTIFSRFLLIIIVLIYIVPIIILICIPARWRYNNKIIFLLLYWFYAAVLRCSLLPIKFEGKKNMLQNRPAIIVANHQSSFDIPLVGVLTQGASHIWLAKKELMDSVILRFVIPFFSVFVDMTSPKKAVRSLREVFSLLNNYHIKDVIIFPEGGRYVDGKVHDFFGGFVTLAKITGRPVIPVCILGVDKVYPPDSFWVHWHPIKVLVGKPFIYQDDDTDEGFKQKVYKWFVEKVEI